MPTPGVCVRGCGGDGGGGGDVEDRARGNNIESVIQTLLKVTP